MASTTNNPLGPQPNLTYISEMHNGIANEVLKFQNTPQFDQTNAILQALTEMSTKIDTMNERINTKIDTAVQQLNGRIDTLNGKLDALETRQRAGDHNHVARVQNSLLEASTDNLHPLVNLTTNDAIPRFPTRSQNIENMERDELDHLIEQLGLPTGGQNNQKRARIRIHIGLAKVRGLPPA